MTISWQDAVAKAHGHDLTGPDCPRCRRVQRTARRASIRRLVVEALTLAIVIGLILLILWAVLPYALEASL